ncbi:hypothetical protein SAMN05443246_4028 [Paenibacillus sp. GP183]|jgi:hypothetical protein|nr:hypothetical protein SAMN05443246_4028 [Paenibacillus sp. GP183]
MKIQPATWLHGSPDLSKTKFSIDKRDLYIKMLLNYRVL